MALITTNRLFLDVEQNRAYSKFGSFDVGNEPFFIQGDQCPVELSLVRRTGIQTSPFEEVAFPGGSTFALKIGTTTAVATSTTTATTPSAPSITVTTLVAYGAGDFETYRVSISPFPKSGYFNLSDGSTNTDQIRVDASTADIVSALQGLGATYVGAVTVNQVGTYTWDISFNSSLVGAAVSLTADDTGVQGFDSRLMTLDMTTAGVATLLNGAASAEATLEFSITVSSEVQTFLYTPCTVINDL